MTSRKTQQEIDKTFKKIDEGIQAFDDIYEKIYAAGNATQKNKLEDNLKREIKKLQRFRDDIKTWAAGNEVKDKGPLLEQRKRIEKRMEQFKAVEKEMKTKAYSKEGLSQNAKQDPKEREREELCDFLTEQVDQISDYLMTLEHEEENLQVAVKKNKRDNAKADKLADVQLVTERFKWHEGKIQLLLRSLRNGTVDHELANDIKDDIETVVKEGKEPDFDADSYEALYDDFDLDNEEAQFGLNNDLDKMSSQDTQSIQDDYDAEPTTIKKTKSEPTATRRPSTQMKSPLPGIAQLNAMPPPPPVPKDISMKPAPLPTRPPGETLKYASAAAAAAASDKSGTGIAPLPPPPSSSIAASTAGSMPPLPAPVKPVRTESPISAPPPPMEKAPSPKPPSVDGSVSHEQSNQSKSPTLSSTSVPIASVPSSVPPTPAMEKSEALQEPVIADDIPTTNGDTREDLVAEESIYHLPPGLQDLLDSFETTKRQFVSQPPASLQRMLESSWNTCPDGPDADRPAHYKPHFRYNTPPHYPQEVLPIFDDPALYENQRMETDSLFYIFYYRQDSYQQYLAARALKNQSWRFHKQYQTWFQRHEEPKQITEEFEQGTYRFFDYESTWMNRRKADFKFVYKFLEDDL